MAVVWPSGEKRTDALAATGFQMEGCQPWSRMVHYGTALSGGISIVDWILRQVTTPTESPEWPLFEEQCVQWQGSCEAGTWGRRSPRWSSHGGGADICVGNTPKRVSGSKFQRPTAHRHDEELSEHHVPESVQRVWLNPLWEEEYNRVSIQQKLKKKIKVKIFLLVLSLYPGLK